MFIERYNMTDELELSSLEKSVLAKILEGNHPILEDLRIQLENIKAIKREFTGYGFFTTFLVSSESIKSRISGLSFAFGDVTAQIDDLEHGAGFVLFVENGAIHVLEGFSYDEKWPETLTNYELNYINDFARDFSGLPMFDD